MSKLWTYESGIRNFFKYSANELADIMGLSSSGREFRRQLPLNTINFSFNRSLPQGTMCLFKMQVLSRSGVIYMEHVILSKIIGENSRQ